MAFHRLLAKWLTSGKSDENIIVENIAEYDQQRELVDLPTNGLVSKYMLEGVVPNILEAYTRPIPTGTILTQTGGEIFYRVDLNITDLLPYGDNIDRWAETAVTDGDVTTYERNFVRTRRVFNPVMDERYLDFFLDNFDSDGATLVDYLITIVKV